MTDRDPLHRARATALRLIAYRPRTEVEIRGRLRRKFPEPVVAAVLAFLKARDLIDDAQFARRWAESRSQRSPRSARAVTRELVARGVDETVADEAAQNIDDDDAAYQAGVKYSNTNSRLDAATFQRRLLAYLQRRGFSQSVSRRAIGRLIDERAATTEAEDVE
jgi:regulatory protein